MLKPLSKVGIEGNFLNMIKVIYEESIYGYIILGIRNFSSKIQNKTRIPTPTIFIQYSIRSPGYNNETRKK